jgi:hypothetical protein
MVIPRPVQLHEMVVRVADLVSEESRAIGADNFLAALGLLCYTEVMGSIERGTLAPNNGRQNFETFFKRLGPEYIAFIQRGDAYSILRCGMAHEYLIKGRCQVAMLRNGESCGVATDQRGTYYFIVEHYFGDFEAACRALFDELMAMDDPALPAELTGRS